MVASMPEVARVPATTEALLSFAVRESARENHCGTFTWNIIFWIFFFTSKGIANIIFCLINDFMYCVVYFFQGILATPILLPAGKFQICKQAGRHPRVSVTKYGWATQCNWLLGCKQQLAS